MGVLSLGPYWGVKISISGVLATKVVRGTHVAQDLPYCPRKMHFGTSISLFPQ